MLENLRARATPNPTQIHPSLTRTHFRLFTSRKSPSVSEHTPVTHPDHQPQNLQAEGQSPAQPTSGLHPPAAPPGLAVFPGEALFLCWSPGQRAAGNQMSPLAEGVQGRQRVWGLPPSGILQWPTATSGPVQGSTNLVSTGSPQPHGLARLSASLPILRPCP